MVFEVFDREAAGTGSIDQKFRIAGALSIQPFVLVQLQVHFRRESGAAGSYTNPLIVSRYSAMGRRYDNEMRRLERAGIGSDDAPYDINLRIANEELPYYRLAKDDQLHITWTDPSAGAVAWGILASVAWWEAVRLAS